MCVLLPCRVNKPKLTHCKAEQESNNRGKKPLHMLSNQNRIILESEHAQQL